jgi:transketolase
MVLEEKDTVSQELVDDLKERARGIREYIVRDLIGVGKVGHLGGAVSSAEIVATLYFHKMKHDPKNPAWEGRDRFLLSKGHVANVQYAALAMAGYFPVEELKKMKSLGAMLQGHPDMTKTPGIEASTGSLGQGLSVANGMAMGLRLDGSKSRVYVIVGDGELNEGQIWEAAMAAAKFKIDNLTAIVDRNRIQATGPTVERFDIGHIAPKWAAFGWHVFEIDGHDIPSLIRAFDEAETVKGKPSVIIANTVKGKGISFAENNVAFHNGILTQEQYDTALAELKKRD